MGVVRFYHLTRSPLDRALSLLAGKAHAAGLRTEVRGATEDRLDALDRALWLGDEAGFLPHGRAGGPHDAMQPVLLTTAQAAAPETRCVMCVDGAPVDPGEAARHDRTFVLFDGEDAAALDHARGQWTALKGAGLTCEYWSEESGRWAQKA